MKSRKRNKVDRAFTLGLKSGLKGHEMESCPFFEGGTRGSWMAGWREGRSNHLWGGERTSYISIFLHPTTI